MAELLAYLFADHHSGGGYPNRGIDDSFFAMEQIVERAIKDKPVWLISLGDAVNKAHTYAEAVVPLKNQLRRASRQADIKIGFIDGNHDKRHASWLSDDEFVHLDEGILHLGDHVWMGLDFRSGEELKEKLEHLPKDVTGLFMHQCWGDFVHFDDVPQAEFAHIPAPIKILATGDFHGESVIETYQGKNLQKILVCNPGSTSVQNILEPEDKFFVGLYDDVTRPFKRIPLRTRRILRVSAIHSAADVDRLVSEIRPAIDEARSRAEAMKLPDNMQKPLLHVTYSAALTDLPRRLEKVVNGKAYLFYTEIRPEKVMATFKANVAAGKGEAFSPLSMLSQEIDPEDLGDPLAEDAYSLAQQLYHCNDRTSIVKKVKEWVESKVKGD